jgi:hypothetical protein
LLAISVVLTVKRPHLHPAVRTSRRFAAVVGVTIVAQGLHFVEELRSDLFVRLPETFGLAPFTETAFVWFNAVWLVIWVVALVAVREGIVVAVCPLWFLALAAVLNALAHPLLALRSGGYFPGLWTAPFVGVLGIVMLRALRRVTASGG